LIVQPFKACKKATTKTFYLCKRTTARRWKKNQNSLPARVLEILTPKLNGACPDDGFTSH